jgi:hydrogenase maturation protein HypF
MADNQLNDNVLGVSWDGTGLGTDGTIWGGEFFSVKHGCFERVAAFRSFMLPGNETAILEPRRAAIGLVFEISAWKEGAPINLPPVRDFTQKELEVISGMLKRKLNAPRTSSVGRLFDAVSALLGIRQRIEFEGQAAMELEFCADSEGDGVYPFELVSGNGCGADGHPQNLDTIDWAPMVQAILEDQRKGISVGRISRQFHNTLAAVIVAVARRNVFHRVVLSGGCFQNRLLTELTVHALREAGFQPYWHQRVPPNDGGIALGQIVAARGKPAGSRQMPEPETTKELEELLV